MRNKKISALLLVMAMLVALVVPVQAAEVETKTILTLNPMRATDNSGNNLTLERVQGLFGEDVTVAEYPSDGYIPTIDVWGRAFMDGQANGYKLINGGVSQRETWSKWDNNGTLTIDLGAVQSVKDVVVWETTHVSDQNVEYSEDDETTGWAAYKDTFSITKAEVSTSTDGATWTTATAYTPVSATKETSFARIVNGKLGRMGHAHVVSLAAAETARYVQVTLTRNGYQFNCDEVMVLGTVTDTTDKTTLLTKNALSSQLTSYVEAATNKKIWDSGRNLAAKQTLVTVTDPLGYATKKDTLSLQNGGLDRNVCASGWSNGQFEGEVLIDLGAPQDVDHVFVWNCTAEKYGSDESTWPTDETPKSSYINATQTYKNITVYTSLTGEDGSWSEGESFDMGERKESDIFYGDGQDYNGITIYQRVYAGYQCDLEETSAARYVKLVITQNIGHLGLAEVAVFGKLGSEKGTKTIVSGNYTLGATNQKVQTVSNVMSSLGQDVTLLDNTAKTVSVTSAQSKIDNVSYVIDGTMGDTSNSSMAWAEYNKKYAEVLIDLGKKAIIDGVDAAIWSNAADVALESLTVSVSTDNVTFTDVYGRSTATAVAVTPVIYEGVPSSTNKNWVGGIRFAPIEAQYVKVRVTQSTANQPKVNEILISGKFEVTATAPVFYDSNSNDWYGDNSFQDVLGSVKTTVSDGTGTLVVAWYNDAEDVKEALLKKVWVATGSGEVSVNISESESEEIISSIAANTGALKAFVFKNVQDASLIAGAVSLTLGE